MLMPKSECSNPYENFCLSLGYVSQFLTDVTNFAH